MRTLYKPRSVNKNSVNPFQTHLDYDSSEKIRDNFLHIKWNLSKKGWTTEDFTSFLGISRPTFYQYGHKTDSKGFRKVPAAQLDLLRREDALRFFRAPEEFYLPDFMKRDEWSVDGQRTYSYLAAVYLSGLSGHPIIAHPDNTRDNSRAVEASKLTLRWFAAARSATRDQICKATNLSDYNIGRIGFVTASWGLEPISSQCERLEKLIGGNKKAA